MVVPAYPSCKHKHSVSNLLFVLHHYFNVFWKILRLGNSAWEYLRVNFCSGIFWGFVKSPRDFWVLIFAPIWLSPLLEIWSTPARMLTESWPSCQPSIELTNSSPKGAQIMQDPFWRHTTATVHHNVVL